ncbi:hypothetical protein ACFSCW_03320 [Sphingomonas tabacisoli]|uniref:Uncharacterized protein n=1 Tax=Sphingomonas tabacisoli TaxID=2249466 RepID=A0ABW4HYS5_9SPHN
MNHEQTIRVMICNTPLDVIRRTIGIVPIEGTVGLIDYGTRDRIIRQRVGLFRKGEWRSQTGAALSEQPTHWTSFFPDKIDVAA